ncbi:hypothetical protein BD770DRAFT_375930 [Pilaira anomala]|nr:hypothetical protein BD770DRAFT_375930 [Pilaira anomala]
MDAYNTIQILSSAFEYTQDQSITEYQDAYATSVVTLDMLKKHIKENEEEIHQLMINKFGSLINFLKDEKTRSMSKKWCFEVITVGEYNMTPLKYTMLPRKALYVMYLPERKKIVQGARTFIEDLCQEIVDCSKQNFLSEDDYRKAADNKNKLTLLFKTVFPMPGTHLEFTGTTKYQLDFEDSDIKITARFPNFEEGFNQFDDFIQKTGGATLLADCLENIEMERVRLNKSNNTCSFSTPSGMPFSINIAKDDYILERDQLILEYLKLDRRVKPFVRTLLYFRREKIVGHLPHLKLLSEMTFIAMVMDFLVKGLDQPLLPNLRDPGLSCAYSRCSFYNVTEETNRHHDCVRIENLAAGVKYTNLKFDGHKPTIWKSYNNDNLGILLKKFFEYYSKKESIETFLTKNNNKSIAIRMDTGSRNDFRFTWKWRDLAEISSKAFELLKDGKDFRNICSD